jgi:hypothetical protein
VRIQRDEGTGQQHGDKGFLHCFLHRSHQK